MRAGGSFTGGAAGFFAAELKTDLSARDLLDALLEVERSLGRVRRERHGPRTIDLDLLLYGNEVFQEPGLTVPHPAMHLRRFRSGAVGRRRGREVGPKAGSAARSGVDGSPPTHTFGSLCRGKKLDDPFERKLLHTVRGVGFMLNEEGL